MNEFQDVVDGLVDGEDGAMRPTMQQSLASAVTVNPDEYAEAKRIADKVGLPVESVLNQPSETKRAARIGEIDFKTYEQMFPSTAAVLSDPVLANMAHDDVEQMGFIEKVSNEFSRGLTGSLRGYDASAAFDAIDTLTTIARIQKGELNPSDPAAMALGTRKASLFAGVQGTPDAVEAQRKYQEARLNDNVKKFLERTQRLQTMPEASPELRQLTEAKGFLGTLAEVTPSNLAQVTAQSLGAQAPTLPLVVAGGAQGRLMRMLAVGGSSSVTEYASSLGQIIDEMKIDVADPQAFEKLVSNPKFQELERQAFIKAGVIGAVDSATAGVLDVRLLNNFYGNAAAQLGVQMAGGGAGEILGSLASGQEVNANAVALEMLGELATVPVEAGSIALEKLNDKEQRAKQAEQNAKNLEALVQATAASKLAQRSPETFEAFMQRVTENGPVPDVYINPTEAQDAGIDLIALAGVSPSVQEQMQVALDTGQDIRIPVSEFAARIANSEQSKGLIDLLKTDPKAMSRREAQQTMSDRSALFQEELKKVEEEKTVDQAWQDSLNEVRSDIRAKLEATGKFNAAMREDFMTPYVSYVQVRAAQMGMTPAGFHQQYGVGVTSQMAAEAAGFSQQGVDINTPEFRKWFKESKVVDAEGKPLVVYHGTDIDVKIYNTKGRGKSARAGSWFTDDPSLAGSYAPRDGGNTNPVYLALQNPVIVDFKGRSWSDAPLDGSVSLPEITVQDDADTVLLNELLGTTQTATARKVRAINTTISEIVPARLDGKITTDEIARWVNDNGYDGVIFKNVIDRGPYLRGAEPLAPSTVFAVFDNTNIKSIFNSGAFDANNPDTLKQTNKTAWSADTELTSAAIEFFGTTRDPYEAGYILPDGTMLDFSGRHYSSDHPSLRGQRNVDHRELTGENNNGFSLNTLLDPTEEGASGSELMWQFMARTGAMRVDIRSGVASVLRPPTSRQLSLLGNALKGEYSAVSYVDAASGRIVDELEQDTTQPAKIKKFFADAAGKDPTGPLFQQNRGAYSPQERLIRLLNAADATTFLHEAAHYFLDIDTQLAALPNAPEELKQDVDATLKWFDLEGETREARLAKWTGMTLDQQRPYHEQFAESFERYLIEGKSPNIDMRNVFRRFRAYMLSVYKSLKQFLANNPSAGQLNDEIRAVFDRMLATAEQISEKQATENMKPMFASAEEAGMTAEQFAAYRGLDIDASVDAAETLQRRSLRDMKWLSNAKSKEIKRLQAEADDKRKAIRREVTDEVMNEPINRATTFLKRGLLNGEQQEGPHKLYIPEVEAMFEGNPAIGAITEKLGYGKYGMLSRENGIHPDQVAEMFGFDSGRSLIDALIGAENPQEKINALTDQRMLERYADLADSEAVERAAEEAIHNEARIRFVATEFAALRANMGNLNELNEAAKTAAQSALGQVKVKDINPNRYVVAAARASREADSAFRKGDRTAAVNAKRKQLFNLAMAREAFAARTNTDKAIRDFRKLFRSEKQMSKYYDMKLVSAARAMLGAYGIGGKVNAARAIDDFKLVAEYDPELHAQLEPIVNLSLQAEGDYKSLPYAEFLAMQEAVNSVAHAARRTKQIRIDGQLVDKKTVVDALRARMQESGIPDLLPGQTQAVTDAERRTWTIQGLRAATRRVESWVDSMDGGAFDGPFRKYIFQPISTAITNYRASKNRVLREYIRLLRERQKDFNRTKIPAVELNYTFENKNELLGALLHIGNESNKRKLLIGRGWGEDVVNALGEKVLDTSRFESFLNRAIKEGTLVKADFDFLQATWDLMESIKGDAQKAHYDMYGYYFNEITANTIKTPFGEYKGGYAPAVADTEQSQDVAVRNEANAIEEGFNFMMPSTATGFTKGRTEYNRPLLMDLRLVAQHIDQVLRFTYVQPSVRDALRIIRSSGFSRPLAAMDDAAVTSLLMPWLHRAARQMATTPMQGKEGKAVTRFLRAARLRTGMVTMTANFVNAFQQITGFTMAAVKVKPRYLKSALLNYMKAPRNTTQVVMELSPWMRNRLGDEMFELQGALTDILEDQNGFTKAQEFSRKHAYFLQRAFQNIVDVTAWQGAYNQALETMTEKQAIQFADSVVRQTQGSTSPEDIARFESGNAFYQLFTQFAGYFNMQANLLGTEFKKAYKDMGGDKGRMAYVYAMGFMLPAVVADAIVRTFGWDWDDDDDDGYIDELMAWFFGSQIRTGVAMFPFVGNVANAAINRLNSQPFDDRISTAPTISVLESAISAPFSVYKAVEGEGRAAKAIGDTLSLITLATGIPVAALSRPLKYLADMEEGRVDPTNAADLTRGLVSGRGRQEERQ